jgi:transketolase
LLLPIFPVCREVPIGAAGLLWAFAVADGLDDLQLIVLVMGSEVGLALEAAWDFSTAVRVISMARMEIFERQDGI